MGYKRAKFGNHPVCAYVFNIFANHGCFALTLARSKKDAKVDRELHFHLFSSVVMVGGRCDPT